MIELNVLLEHRFGGGILYLTWYKAHVLNKVRCGNHDLEP